ncbi:MAG TPA: VWA domain-containing protein [Candidatus Acidoferrum sp.]|nr:VWA domain-containing protein [Candidatus Acidoferrum sp.]
MSHFKKACRIQLRQAFLFALLALPNLTNAQEQQTPAIRVEVSRVNVGVIATDRHGKFVEGLQKSDFHIFDNGIEQPIAGFLANDDPAQVVLMLECGPSVYLFGAANIQKADALIANLSPADRVAIVCYSSGANVQFELSDNKAEARLALREINFYLGSGDLNLSRSLLDVFGWLRNVPGKKSVVLIGSGVDSAPPEFSATYKNQILSSEVRVLAVSTSNLLTLTPKHRKRSKQQRESLEKLEPLLQAGEDTLRNLATSTGGRVYLPKSTKDFERTYSEIAQIVRHEYNLAFAPQIADGKLHSLTVTANHAARLDHRQAYLAPASSAN